MLAVLLLPPPLPTLTPFPPRAFEPRGSKKGGEPVAIAIAEVVAATAAAGTHPAPPTMWLPNIPSPCARRADSSLIMPSVRIGEAFLPAGAGEAARPGGQTTPPTATLVPASNLDGLVAQVVG